MGKLSRPSRPLTAPLWDPPAHLLQKVWLARPVPALGGKAGHGTGLLQGAAAGAKELGLVQEARV